MMVAAVLPWVLGVLTLALALAAWGSRTFRADWCALA